MAGQDSSGKIQPKAWSPQTTAICSALMYAFGVLIVCGGAGIWLPVFTPLKTVGIDALTTYVMATLAPVLVDLLLDAEVYGNKLTKFWRISFVVSCFVAGALAFIALIREHSPGDWLAGITAVVMSIAIWATLAVKSERFLQMPSTTGSIGGKTPTPENLSGGGL